MFSRRSASSLSYLWPINQCEGHCFLWKTLSRAQVPALVVPTINLKGKPKISVKSKGIVWEEAVRGRCFRGRRSRFGVSPGGCFADTPSESRNCHAGVWSRAGGNQHTWCYRLKTVWQKMAKDTYHYIIVHHNTYTIYNHSMYYKNVYGQGLLHMTYK